MLVGCQLGTGHVNIRSRWKEARDMQRNFLFEVFKIMGTAKEIKKVISRELDIT